VGAQQQFGEVHQPGTIAGFLIGLIDLLPGLHLDANLPQDFQILDSEDQLRLLKRLIKAMNLDESSAKSTSPARSQAS
jgi:DNA helicase-2/ATP-dependent DNA helicase PcrA